MGWFDVFGKLPEKETCSSCGLVHKEVECRGIYYCPNPLCTISGTASHRSKFKSRKETSDGGYTIDPEEAVVEGLRQVVDRRDTEILDAAIKKLVEYWAPLLKKQWIKESEYKEVGSGI